jgi:hypothetical protein
MAVHSFELSSRGRRHVMRSTIYSGFRTRRIAMKIQFEERRHSNSRGSSMGTPSGFVAGSFSRSSRPPGHGLTLCFNQRRPFGGAQSDLSALFTHDLHHGLPIPATALEHRHHHTQQPTGHRRDGTLLPATLSQGLEHRAPTPGMNHQTPGRLHQRPAQQT